MKATIIINRHVVAQNKKQSKESGRICDFPAISIRTYRHAIYCKEVEFTGKSRLIQDARNARCSGATIWIEAEFESLVIDGKPAVEFIYESVGY
jgi:hypothetical protein